MQSQTSNLELEIKHLKAAIEKALMSPKSTMFHPLPILDQINANLREIAIQLEAMNKHNGVRIQR